MARITASVYTSHVPAIGAAMDLGKAGDPYWQPLFKGFEHSRQWLKDNRPDVIFLVYNDHATAFSLDFIPTFAIGTAAEYQPADEGWGPRPVPKVVGHPELASHIAQSVIQQDFDRSEEHTSELQSPCNLVCRLLLEKKNKICDTLRPLVLGAEIRRSNDGRAPRLLRISRQHSAVRTERVHRHDRLVHR